MPLRRLLRPGWRGKRGAGALEYALLIFLMLVVGFLAWKYLGGSVSKSTEKTNEKFDKSGGSGQTVAAGGGGGDQSQSQSQSGQSGGGGGNKPAQGSPGADHSKAGTPGGAGVATVQKPGTGGPVDAHGGSGRAVAAEEGGKKPKNWLKYFMIALLVVGLMAAVYTFGKKKSTA